MDIPPRIKTASRRIGGTEIVAAWGTGGIEVYIEGYGTKNMPPGTSAPIYLEIQNGVPKLYVWADINSEDPTHIIDLSGAKEA